MRTGTASSNVQLTVTPPPGQLGGGGVLVASSHSVSRALARINDPTVTGRLPDLFAATR
jgi:hypothetical protein